MDELKLKLSTKFMRGIVTSIISKLIEKKYGYKIDILLNAIELKNENGKVRIHADVEAEVDSDEFGRIIKSIGM